jgi:ubiquitin carboxyl-terminal hydrolase 8
MVIESSEVIELFWACIYPKVQEGQQQQQQESTKKKKKDSRRIDRGGGTRGGDGGGRIERANLKKKDDRRGEQRQRKSDGSRDISRKNMGESCSKMKQEDMDEVNGDSANAVATGVTVDDSTSTERAPQHCADNVAEDLSRSSSSPTSSPLPSTPEGGRRRSLRLLARRSPKSSLHHSRLLRVGSRRTPNSPARASHYGHVHDAVNLNFSALEGTVDGFSSATGLPLGVVGLRNLGNTCFLNSSLQCLSATIPLTDYFLGYDYRKELNPSNPLGTGGKLAVAYAELMKAMWLSEPNNTPYNSHSRLNPTRRTRNSNSADSSVAVTILRPTSFKSALETFAPQFVGNHQHDAQELLAFLLDGIHEDLNRIQRKPYVEDPDFDGTSDERDAATAWRNYLQRDKSLVVDVFQGQSKCGRQCCTCHHVNVKFEPFMYLSLPISENCRTLDDCADLYLQEERLDGDNQWYCSKCQTHRDAIQKTSIWVLPPILIVHLKRFNFNDQGRIGSKNNASIEYPFSWDLSRLCQHPGGYQGRYELYAVSNHVGGMSSGHYTAYGKNRFDDGWYLFDDSVCRRVSERTLVKNRSSAYLLFYNRVEQLPPPTPLLPPPLPFPPGQHGAGETATAAVHLHRAPLVRRQSVSRPDLWPHAQVHNNQYRAFARQSARSASSSFPGDDPLPPPIPLASAAEEDSKLPPSQDKGKFVEL